ncbi:hypothetical protein OIU76_016934 [Salix suchowensis]|nr:hypothetical protein OIU76_016934 [Salix suchowensis]
MKGTNHLSKTKHPIVGGESSALPQDLVRFRYSYRLKTLMASRRLPSNVNQQRIQIAAIKHLNNLGDNGRAM